MFWSLSQHCFAVLVNNSVAFLYYYYYYLFVVFLLLFFVVIVALDLQLKSALKAYDCHMTTTCGNFKMAISRPMHVQFRFCSLHE